MSKYAYSFNGENYTGKFDSREDAIREAAETQTGLPFPHMEVYVGECVDPAFDWPAYAENIITDIGETLCDNYGGDLGESFSDQVSLEDEETLDERINEAIRGWIRDCNITAGFYTVKDVEKVFIGNIIPEEYEV